MQDKNISPLQEFIHNRYVWAFIAIDILAIIVVASVFFHQAAKVSTINFNVTPLDATISVNGDKHYANGQYKIAPGKYKISISHDGLETKTFSVDIGSRNYTNVTVFLTNANKNFEFYTLQKNYESLKKLKTIASAENNITTDKDTSAQQFITNYEHIMSIKDALPLKGYVYSEPSANMSTGRFTIENGQSNRSCKKSTCLLVRYYGKDYENAVLEKIKEAGYNPDDYEIVYEGNT